MADKIADALLIGLCAMASAWLVTGTLGAIAVILAACLRK